MIKGSENQNIRQNNGPEAQSFSGASGLFASSRPVGKKAAVKKAFASIFTCSVFTALPLNDRKNHSRPLFAKGVCASWKTINKILL
ncbi:MAG: hypothetical protein QMD09_13955 [Desulfatibacillaceae bacterium]|nr:hypothetical protein [Desulfatibacillaceae bacterium]